MKFLVVGAGAVGGVVAARLAATHDVTVVARGAHAEAIRARGLTVYAPSGTEVVQLRVLDAPVVTDDTIVLLAVKTQDVAAALRSIVAPPQTALAVLVMHPRLSGRAAIEPLPARSSSSTAVSLVA